LTLSEDQRERTLEAMVMLVSQPPGKDEVNDSGNGYGRISRGRQ
jgi:hypothetical protein